MLHNSAQIDLAKAASGSPLCLLWLVLGVWCLQTMPLAGDEGPAYSEEERAHWSLQPRTQPVVPTILDSAAKAWPANPIDAFVLSRLRQAVLEPAAEAAKGVLVRRLSIALRGLPPSPEEISRFAADRSPDAYERLVDRLLASPQYGEAWAQHWLDVARYSESEGFEYDRHRPGAWRFRDYVVRSFNGDKPFNQFVVEQLAGDELTGADEETRTAAGFHRLGPVRRNAGNTDVAFSRNEVLTEMTDAVGAVFLGLTVGCARCHDHMFDPIRQKDYYRLQAFLAATHEHNIQIGNPEDVKRWNAENDAIQAEITKVREALDTADGEEREKLQYQLKSLRKREPAPLPTISGVANDPSKRSTIHLLERGQTDKPKEPLGPRLLGVFLSPDAPEFAADMHEPKLQLARWLVDPKHPLTARVLVNRLWHYQFGQGIVATPNDFGVNGAAPSHPELLDYLANELMAGEWGVKRMQRMIVTSGTYRQSSAIAECGVRSAESGQVAAVSTPHSEIRNPQSIDPENRLLWRFNRRRLTAEQLRDAMLAVSGRLNLALGGASVMPPVDKQLVDLLYDRDQWQVTPDERQHDRRSIYLVAKRNLKLPFMEVFDQPDLQTSCARREASTHAPQALEMLNGELANGLAGTLAERLERDVGDDRGRQVEQAFWLVAGRAPTEAEKKVALEFLKEQPLSEFALAMFNLNAFVYVE
jgi:hypothetical protein